MVKRADDIQVGEYVGAKGVRVLVHSISRVSHNGIHATFGRVSVEIAPPTNLVVLQGYADDGKEYHLRYQAGDHVEMAAPPAN